MGRKRRKFSREFTVKLVKEGGMSVNAAARDLGICATSLQRWVKQYAIDHGEGPSPGADGGAVRVTPRKNSSAIVEVTSSSGTGRKRPAPRSSCVMNTKITIPSNPRPEMIGESCFARSGSIRFSR